MSPEDPRHGRVAGYRAGCRNSCCRRGINHYNQTRKLRTLEGEPARLASAAGSRLRLRALVALGWSFPTLADHAGYDRSWLRVLATGHQPTVEPNTALRIRRLYDDLAMTLPTATNTWQRRSITRAREYASNHGWLPPLALEDDRLDDPSYQPKPPRLHTGLGQQLLDHAVVERVLSGQPRPRKLTRAESTEIYRRLRARGHSTTEIENTYGINSQRYARPEGDTAA